MNTKDILIAARARIENKTNWFGGDEPLRDDSIDQRCAIMAINDICPAETDDYGRVRNALKRGMYASSVVEFNDSHTHAEVLAAFDRAIAQETT